MNNPKYPRASEHAVKAADLPNSRHSLSALRRERITAVRERARALRREAQALRMLGQSARAEADVATRRSQQLRRALNRWTTMDLS